MTNHRLRMAIRSTTAFAILGVASQAQALGLNANDVSAELYGFARLNAAYDINEDIGISTQAGNFTGVGSSDGSGFFGADAEQSRLGVNINHKNGVKINIEGDFRGGDLRIRHAYGEYQNWLAGRTWSNFNSFVGYTPTLDFDANAGNAGVQDRVAQARYTTGPLSFSLEDPKFQRIAGVFQGDDKVAAVGGTPTVITPAPELQVNGDAGTANAALPVATVRFEQSLTKTISVSLAGLVQEVSSDDDTLDDSVIGYGAFAAARLAVTGAISIQGAINYTDGANGYLYRSGNGGFGAADAYVDNNGKLEAIQGYGGTLGVSMDTGNGSNVNLAYGFATVDWDDAADDLGAARVADRHETNSNVLLNYQMTPVENVMVGIEYGYFEVERHDGNDDEASRVLFAAQYNF